MRKINIIALLLIITVLGTMGCESVTSNVESVNDSNAVSESITLSEAGEGITGSSIISPEDGAVFYDYGIIDFLATYEGTLSPKFPWAVREGGGSCPTSANNVAAWDDGNTYNATAEDGEFSVSIDMSNNPVGTYCFVINPGYNPEGGEYRIVHVFELGPSPVTTSECKNGGWTEYGFKNQGQCVRYVNTGKDSR